MADRAARVWRWLVGLADSRRGVAYLAGVAVAVHAVESIGWPARNGRDFVSYIRVYDQLWDWHAVLPWTTLQRPHLSPLVVGGALDLGGGWGAEVLLAALFAGSVVAWAAAARVAGPGAAVFTAIALLVHPGYGELFHELSGDVVFAAGFAFWAPLLTRAVDRPTAARFVVAGAGVAALSLVRPGNQVLALVALVPLVMPLRWRRRIGWSVATAAAAVLPLVAWASLNGLRYDDVAVARGTGATVPMFRAFVDDRIVDPENGPASRRLAELVERELLPLEPYRSYGIDIDEFFSSGSPRMHEDLVSLSDRVLGWDSDYALLSDVAWEAVRAHPGAYAKGVARDFVDALTQPLYGPSTEEGDRAADSQDELAAAAPALPRPTDGQPIPAANQGSYLGTPENRIREDWKSPELHVPEFSRAGDAERYERVAGTVADLETLLPTHRRVRGVARLLDQGSRLYPPALVWLLVGAAAVAWRRPRAWRAATAPTIAALLVLAATLAGLPFVALYGIPLVPAFVLLAGAGLVGARQQVDAGVRSNAT